ncbi:MAG TPA: DUF378 domain-containing protein [Candidatus Saccharimonadales bacterium]|nr:DUF378 domain-containing protein [Candidatus Saccharimonadales bacterium]
MKFNVVDWVALALTIVGGLNWGLVGAFDFNLVDTLFGAMSVLARIVYLLVGLAALYLIVTAAKMTRTTEA